MVSLKVLAKHGICISTDAAGYKDIQRIDDPETFAEDNELDFIPPYLESDDEAKRVYKGLTDKQ